MKLHFQEIGYTQWKSPVLPVNFIKTETRVTHLFYSTWQEKTWIIKKNVIMTIEWLLC